MSHRILTILILITGLTFSATAFAKEPKTARPLDFDREVMQIADNVFELTLEPGEEADFAAKGIKRVAVDETRFADIRVQDDQETRLVLTGRSTGKAVVLLFGSDGKVTTLIVTVAGKGALCSTTH